MQNIHSYDLSLIDQILDEWANTIGDDFQGYRNHVQRMVRCCLLLQDCNQEERDKIMIAACFHDIGIWTANTLDYIDPSVPPAMAYLESRGLSDWAEEISLMITEHHKLKAYTNDSIPLVELFRQADLVDFSLGIFRFGLPKEKIRQLKGEFPNAGFHKTLVRLASRWFVKHPLNPAPMMKW